MEILNIKIIRGPNYWSNYWKKLIVVELDLKQYEELPTHLIPGFGKHLSNLLPSLENHYCSEGHKGGFLKRLKEGTWLGHVIEHVALEIQSLAGMDNCYGRTRSAGKKGIYNIVFSYEIEEAGIYAAKTAVKIVETIAAQDNYIDLETDIAELKAIKSFKGLGSSARALVQEAAARNIPLLELEEEDLLMLGHGCKQKLLASSLTSHSSFISVNLVSNKEKTKKILAAAYLPVPKGIVVTNQSELDFALNALNYPMTIKPLDSNHGRGVTTNIFSKKAAVLAFHRAANISSRIIIEEFVQGGDFRFLVVNYKLVAVAERIPAFIIGNGTATIKELIAEVNNNPHRGNNHENILTKITLDKTTNIILEENNLNADSILPKDQKIFLKYTANLSTGGTSQDVTDIVHPKNKLIAERIARLMNLDVCGIDVIMQQIDQPLTRETGAIIEVNASPGLRMHLNPTVGMSRNVAKNIIDMLYPSGSDSRIPLIAITGTNGKTTTTRLVAFFAQQIGYHVGYTTTDGVYINNQLVRSGDCSGPGSARMILRDPLVNFAVLECARGGILRAGLGFDKCSISILTNISCDHLGIDGIETMEQLRQVKSVVLHSTANDGYAILNADDDIVYSLKDELDCKLAFFSIQDNNARIKEHILKKEICAYIMNNELIVQKNYETIILGNLMDFPLTMNGTSRAMIQNILAAVLAGILSNMPTHAIHRCLTQFMPNSEYLPGRMNLFDFVNFKILVDYAHNVGAFLEIKEYLKTYSNRKIGIIGCPGDRRPEDMMKIGFHSAEIFDEILIHLDEDGRGKTHEEISQFLIEGIRSQNSLKKITVIADEQKALEHAMETALTGDFILHFPEKPQQAINYLASLIKAKSLSDEIPLQ